MLLCRYYSHYSHAKTHAERMGSGMWDFCEDSNISWVLHQLGCGEKGGHFENIWKMQAKDLSVSTTLSVGGL